MCICVKYLNKNKSNEIQDTKRVRESENEEQLYLIIIATKLHTCISKTNNNF